MLRDAEILWSCDHDRHRSITLFSPKCASYHRNHPPFTEITQFKHFTRSINAWSTLTNTNASEHLLKICVSANYTGESCTNVLTLIGGPPKQPTTTKKKLKHPTTTGNDCWKRLEKYPSYAFKAKQYEKYDVRIIKELIVLTWDIVQ